MLVYDDHTDPKLSELSQQRVHQTFFSTTLASVEQVMRFLDKDHVIQALSSGAC